MESTHQRLSFRALSARMILCRGRDTSAALHLRLSGVPLRAERLQIMVDLTAFAQEGNPLLVPAWHGTDLYLHPDGEVIDQTATYFRTVDRIGLGKDITDITFEDCHDHPGHHDADDILSVHPEVYREQ